MLDAALTADMTIPAGMAIEAGSPLLKIWRLRNSGDVSWHGCWLQRVDGDLSATVTWQPLPPAEPGEVSDIPLELVAPPRPGRARERWRLHGSDGRPFGPILRISIDVVPLAPLNSRFAGFQTSAQPGTAAVPAGNSFEHTLFLENTGGRPWPAGGRLVFLGGDAAPQETGGPLPAAAPGAQAELRVALTAPAGGDQAGRLVTTYWQMRDERGVPFGQVFTPAFELVAAPEPPPLPAADPAAWRKVIWDITGIFESGRVGGDPAAFQNHDEGIISYGRHQVTLASGNLGRVLAVYTERSGSPTARALREKYLGRVQALDPTLRHDGRLRELLLAAAAEPEMSQAQDDIFAEGFYNPTVELAAALGLVSPLGLACLYDTRIQHGGGGLDFLVGLTRSAFAPPPAEGGAAEPAWLAAFLAEREALLNRLADRRQAEAGQTSDPGRQRSLLQTAEALRISTFRVRELRTLLQAGNLNLRGPFQVRGRQINGLSI